METTRCALILLVSVCLWTESYTSSIELCTDSPTSFVNGTAIPAMLGQPVSVVFCVQCDPSLYIVKYIQINHTHHPTKLDYYYTNNKPNSGPITVNITSSANKATINININTVQEDFTNQFSVRIHTNRGVGDYSVFVFHLSDAATSGATPDDSLILSTQPNIPAATSVRIWPASSSTELSTVTSQASTASTSTRSPTQEITQCWPNKTSLCPENGYQVDNETCLLVTGFSNNALPKDICKGHGSKPVTRKNIENLRSCLIKILGESKGASNNDVVRVDRTNYFDVQSGTYLSGTWANTVVCVHKTSNVSPPDVSIKTKDHPMTPASASTSALPQTTRLATLLTQARTVLSTLFTSTPVMPRCLPVKKPSCPQDWYQVDNDMCLIVMSFPYTNYPSPYSRDVCTDHGGKPVLEANISNFRECLKYILRQSMPEPINYEVRLGYYVYVNVQNEAKTQVSSYTKYNVACLQKKEYFKSPTVPLFSLKIYSEKEWRLVENSTNYITVNTAFADVMFKCDAEGVPKPHVRITNESGDQVTAGSWIRHYVCNPAGAYTCTASNFLGTSGAHGRIRILSPHTVKVSQFTANNRNRRKEIRSNDTVELKCSVDGCPDRVTITRNAHSIAEMTNYTLPLVHEIKGVNCSHMATYTCLAKSPTGRDVQETADLEVQGCPVSLCESETASREMMPTMGGNVTFSLCLISSVKVNYSVNDTKIRIKVTNTPKTRVYWTVSITMYNIQVQDYRTHTVRIENGDGNLDIHFTLTDEGSAPTPVGQKAEDHESESNALLIALPPVGFIILVFIIVGIVWYRVKGTRVSRTRSEEVIDRGSGNDDSGEVTYANLTSVGRVPEGQEEEYEEYSNTTDLHGQESGRFITADGLVYLTVVNVNKEINKRSQGGKHTSKHKCGDEGHVEYITLDFEKTGKLLVADDVDNKDDDSEEKTDTRQ